MSVSQEKATSSSSSTTEFESLPAFYPPNATEKNTKEDFEITHREFEQIKDALKKAEFRKLLVEYVEDVQDPENQKTYQSEVRQLEKEHGNVIHFLNPVPGYVLKTSVDGQKKGFINICANPLIRRATLRKEANNGDKNGFVWSIPHAQSPPREDCDKSGTFCVVYDIIFHPDSLRLAEQNPELRKQIEATALDGVESSFKVVLDRKNIKKSKIEYKGVPRAIVIKYKIGQPIPSVVDPTAIKNELPPMYFAKNVQNGSGDKTANKAAATRNNPKMFDANYKPMSKIEKKLRDFEDEEQEQKLSSVESTAPRYSIKYRSHVDLQDCCFDNQRSGRSSKPIPDEVILTIDLPLLSDSSTLDADVLEDGWHFEMKSTRKANYELKLKLPFQVHPESAKAKFEKDKRKLHVTINTVQVKKSVDPIVRQLSDEVFEVSSENNDDDPPKKKLVEEILERHTGSGGEADVGYESTESYEMPVVINGNIVVKSILKGSSNNVRCRKVRSKSESWLEHMDHLHKEDFESLESLSESNELLTISESSGDSSSALDTKNVKVRFSDKIQSQLYRSDSSILGQRKKNQRKNKNKRKNRERHNSEGSSAYSSFDEDHEPLQHKALSLSATNFGGSNKTNNKKNKKPCKSNSLEEM